jgi:hypothetical protein
MQVLDVHDDNIRFFKDLAHSKRRVLVVDYDRVIAPYGDETRGTPCPTIAELLDCIMTTSGTRVVLMTGRHAPKASPVSGPAPDVCQSDGSTTPQAALSTMLAKMGEGTAVAFLSDRDCPKTNQRGTTSDSAPACRQASLQFLVDWLRVCGGEIC